MVIYIFNNGTMGRTALAADGTGCGTGDSYADYDRRWGKGNYTFETIPDEEVEANSHRGFEEAYTKNQAAWRKLANERS